MVVVPEKQLTAEESLTEKGFCETSGRKKKRKTPSLLSVSYAARRAG